jgi:hypothetical protein
VKVCLPTEAKGYIVYIKVSAKNIKCHSDKNPPKSGFIRKYPLEKEGQQNTSSSAGLNEHFVEEKKHIMFSK